MWCTFIAEYYFAVMKHKNEVFCFVFHFTPVLLCGLEEHPVSYRCVIPQFSLQPRSKLAVLLNTWVGSIFHTLPIEFSFFREQAYALKRFLSYS